MSARPCFLFDVAMLTATRLATSPGSDEVAAIEHARAVVSPDDTNLMKQLPVALIYPLRETPAASVGGRVATVQRVTSELGVLHVIRVINDKSGRVDHVGETIEATRKSLIRWTPVIDEIGTADYPLALAGGELQEIADGRLYWLDRYTVGWTLDSQRFGPAKSSLKGV